MSPTPIYKWIGEPLKTPYERTDPKTGKRQMCKAYRAIKISKGKDDEVFVVGDYTHCLNERDLKSPFIGAIEKLFEDPTGTLFVLMKWLWWPAELKIKRRPSDLLKHELIYYFTDECNENEVSVLLEKVDILFTSALAEAPSSSSSSSSTPGSGVVSRAADQPDYSKHDYVVRRYYDYTTYLFKPLEAKSVEQICHHRDRYYNHPDVRAALESSSTAPSTRIPPTSTKAGASSGANVTNNNKKPSISRGSAPSSFSSSSTTSSNMPTTRANQPTSASKTSTVSSSSTLTSSSRARQERAPSSSLNTSIVDEVVLVSETDGAERDNNAIVEEEDEDNSRDETESPSSSDNRDDDDDNDDDEEEEEDGDDDAIQENHHANALGNDSSLLSRPLQIPPAPTIAPLQSPTRRLKPATTFADDNDNNKESASSSQNSRNVPSSSVDGGGGGAMTPLNSNLRSSGRVVEASSSHPQLSPEREHPRVGPGYQATNIPPLEPAASRPSSFSLALEETILSRAHATPYLSSSSSKRGAGPFRRGQIVACAAGGRCAMWSRVLGPGPDPGTIIVVPYDVVWPTEENDLGSFPTPDPRASFVMSELDGVLQSPEEDWVRATVSPPDMDVSQVLSRWTGEANSRFYLALRSAVVSYKRAATTGGFDNAKALVFRVVASRLGLPLKEVLSFFFSRCAGRGGVATAPRGAFACSECGGLSPPPPPFTFSNTVTTRSAASTAAAMEPNSSLPSSSSSSSVASAWLSQLSTSSNSPTSRELVVCGRFASCGSALCASCFYRRYYDCLCCDTEFSVINALDGSRVSFEEAANGLFICPSCVRAPDPTAPETKQRTDASAVVNTVSSLDHGEEQLPPQQQQQRLPDAREKNEDDSVRPPQFRKKHRVLSHHKTLKPLPPLPGGPLGKLVRQYKDGYISNLAWLPEDTPIPFDLRPVSPSGELVAMVPASSSSSSSSSSTAFGRDHAKRQRLETDSSGRTVGDVSGSTVFAVMMVRLSSMLDSNSAYKMRQAIGSFNAGTTDGETLVRRLREIARDLPNGEAVCQAIAAMIPPRLRTMFEDAA